MTARSHQLRPLYGALCIICLASWKRRSLPAAGAEVTGRDHSKSTDLEFVQIFISGVDGRARKTEESWSAIVAMDEQGGDATRQIARGVPQASQDTSTVASIVNDLQAAL